MTRTKGEFILWRVTGESCSDSGGGDTTFFVATKSAVRIPDVRRACRELTREKYSLYDVTQVEQAGRLEHDEAWPDLATLDDPMAMNIGFGDEHDCHDQTGYDFDAPDLRRLAFHILSKSKPARPTLTLTSLQSAAPELLAEVEWMHRQLAGAVAIMPCVADLFGPCLHCELVEDFERIMHLRAKVAGI